MNLARSIWDLLDGKKTYTGIITTGIGLAGLIFGQEWAASAQQTAESVTTQIEAQWPSIVAVFGLIMSLIGGVHKDLKATKYGA